MLTSNQYKEHCQIRPSREIRAEEVERRIQEKKENYLKRKAIREGLVADPEKSEKDGEANNAKSDVVIETKMDDSSTVEAMMPEKLPTTTPTLDAVVEDESK